MFHLNLTSIYFVLILVSQKTTKQFMLILTLLSRMLKKTFPYLRIKNINFTQFNQDITIAFANFKHPDLDSKMHYFKSTLSSIFEKYMLLKTVTVILRTLNPWFISNLLNEKSKRRQLER